MCNWIRDGIRKGLLAPGQRLVEADITRETGVARAKVREALRRLETEGVVVLEEYRGASVKRVSLDEVKQIYRTRMVLEGLAAREFALADDPAGKDTLARIQLELDQWAAAGNHEQFARLNQAWHQTIVEGSGNAYLATFLERLVVPVYRLLFAGFYSTARIQSANADHARITAAICAGDADAAETAMRDHVQRGLEAVSELNAQFA